MHMNFCQFMVFICDLMACLALFCVFMARKTSGIWDIVGFSAFLVIVGIIAYFLFNVLVKEFIKALSD